MFLHYLPLRPSTLEILTKAGFEHVQEVVASRNEGGGLANFAAELGIASNNIEQAHEIYNEITELLIDASTNDNNNDKDEENYNNNCDNNNSRRRPLVIANKKPKTAVELLQQHTTNNNGSGSTTSNSTTGSSSIITFCRAIDTILHGGIPLGVLTELSGCPGSGKTAIAMQLAVNTCGLPKFIGGVGGGVGGSGTRSQTIYIDTEGSFSSERCYTMAKSLISHIQNGLLKKKQKHTINSNSSFNTGEKWNCKTPEDILRSIHVFRVHDVSELETVLYGSIPHMLMNAINNNNNIKLIVIDSIAFPFRSAAASASDNTDYYITRTRKLTQISNQLNLWSTKYNLAVLAINQMTTKKIILMMGNNNNNNNTHYSHKLVPALGETWAHSVTIRLELSISTTTTVTTTSSNTVHVGEQQQQSNNPSSNNNRIIRRYCKLTKSPCLPTTGELAEFQIVESGIRGV